MLDKWTGEVVGTMHIYGISFTKLANQMGISNRYTLDNSHSPDSSPNLTSIYPPIVPLFPPLLPPPLLSPLPPLLKRQCYRF